MHISRNIGTGVGGYQTILMQLTIKLINLRNSGFAHTCNVHTIVIFHISVFIVNIM